MKKLIQGWCVTSVNWERKKMVTGFDVDNCDVTVLHFGPRGMEKSQIVIRSSYFNDEESFHTASLMVGEPVFVDVNRVYSDTWQEAQRCIKNAMNPPMCNLIESEII